MSNQLELFPKPPESTEVIVQAKEAIKKILERHRQPVAEELLRELEREIGWYVRHVYGQVIAEMRDDKTISTYLREYLKTTLNDKNILAALREGTKPTPQEKSTLDELFRKSLLYRDSNAFKEALAFSAKFRDYAPYNNLLVRVQNPSCSYYATARDWKSRFGRRVKEDARPMLILAPMHPVMLVFDLDQTEGKDIPEHLKNFAKATGDFDPDLLYRTLENAERLCILVDSKTLSTTHGGFVTTRLYDTAKYKMRIVLHDKLSEAESYAVLCHEIGHILLGHLGTDEDHWWPCRIGLTHDAIEVEAESVSYMVAARLGLETSSDAYLAGYAKDGKIPEGVSLDLIAKVAGRISEMGEHLLPKRKRKDKESEAD
ncbi:MAG: ImmA/IrrE family metallo-endopeptidase [Pseudomonadota bacterium]